MLYIYRPRVSEGARLLEDALNDSGVPAWFTQGRLLRERFRPERDKLICWGAHVLDHQGLNNCLPRTKFQEAMTLRDAQVRTVEVSLTRPEPTGRGLYEFGRGLLEESIVRQVIAHAQAWLDAPILQAEWLPRRNNHIGGSDLLNPGQADYFSRKENIIEEYRLHIFRGKSIRAGIKVPREDAETHEWIRSFDAGWRIQYDGFKSRREQRDLASSAVAALGLDFGAVDLGRLDTGELIVLEVNRAPGIEGGSVDAYVGGVKRWIEE